MKNILPFSTVVAAWSGCVRLAFTLLLSSTVFLATAAYARIAVDKDDIAGVVRGPQGPEAGVWVIAETRDLPTRFAKIVVTDDKGRYLIPDLPKASYRVWVRGYGLVDSRPVNAVPGKNLNLQAVAAPDPRAAAQYYPANYWLSLLHVPAESEFPGTGNRGNGISAAMPTQGHWIYQVKEMCSFCHQLGSKATREIPADLGKFDSSTAAWAHRITKGPNGPFMTSLMGQFGRRGIREFADWTDRIAAGEVPAAAPPRPAGVERNLVLTLWDWAGGAMIHDEIGTDKRQPTLNAGGRVYGVSTRGDNGHKLVWVDPKTNTVAEVPVPTQDPAVSSTPHNPMFDETGRVWITSAIRDPEKSPAFCTDPSNRYAKFFPLAAPNGSLRQVSVYNPETGRFDLIDTCFGTHHLQFGHDAGRTLYLSGDTQAIGWVDTRTFDRTGNAEASTGWCPMVLDTNGDGRIGEWTNPGEPDDPKKDKRLAGFLYGMGVSPLDDSVWYARYTYFINDWMPGVPGGLIRFVRGDNPPETCRIEYYEIPLKDGKAVAFNPRGVDLDSDGVAWVALGSGRLGRFDRRQCKTLSGPDATGQHCPEGWSFFDTPGPHFKGVATGSADWHYLTWVDQHEVLGIGKDLPIMPGSTSDSLLVFQPESKSFVTLRVPYPLGFYARGLDGRIDDPRTGWKGRALWANYGTLATTHIEGPDTNSRIVKFQLRPNPLAK